LFQTEKEKEDGRRGMSKTRLILPDAHAHYQHHNKRAEWAGELIADVKPDVVICIGDLWDMPSLSSYDRGKKSFQGRTYQADFNAGLDFQERLWTRVLRRKRKLPRRVFCMGNHEERIARAINVQPELEGAVGYSDLQLDRWYTDVVHYQGSTPGTIEIDGISYAHYFVSGVAGRPVGGEHPPQAWSQRSFRQQLRDTFILLTGLLGWLLAAVGLWAALLAAISITTPIGLE
jgi:hypothetical protein